MRTVMLVVGIMACAIIPTLLNAGDSILSLRQLFDISDNPGFALMQDGQCVSQPELAPLISANADAGHLSGPGFSMTGDAWLVALAESGTYQIHYKGRMVFSCKPGDLFNPLFVTETPASMWALTDCFGRYSSLVRIASNGEVEIFYSDPNSDVDGVVGSGPDGTDLAAAYHFEDRIRYHFFSPVLEQVHNVATDKFPDADILWINGDGNNSKWLCKMLYKDRPECWRLFIAGETEPVTLHESPSVNGAIESISITYPTRDGLEASGYLTLPKRREALYPLVVFIHGGPADRVYPYFDPRVQALAREGYAVFQPNYRGSRGLGKAWMRGGWREWGTGAAQHDITDGALHLVENGIAAPKRIAVLGGSFGGYAALAGLTFTPELYACGITFFGPTDLLAFIREDKGPYVAMNKPMYGDVENSEDAERLRLQSPLNSYDKIRAPLFLYHGVADPLVPVAHSDSLAAKLAERGVEVEYRRHPEAEHGFLDSGHEADTFAEILNFLGRHMPRD